MSDTNADDLAARKRVADDAASFLADEYLIACEQSGMPFDLRNLGGLRALCLLAYERGYIDGAFDIADTHTRATGGRCTFDIHRATT